MTKKKMDVYPWAVPTDEQKRLFDDLNYDEQLQMVRAALEEGDASGESDRTHEKIIAEARAKLQQLIQEGEDSPDVEKFSMDNIQKS